MTNTNRILERMRITHADKRYISVIIIIIIIILTFPFSRPHGLQWKLKRL